MRRALLTLSLLPALLVAQSPQAPRASRAAAAALTTAEEMDRARFAWEAGKYEEALLGLQRVLRAPDASDFHDRVAELTGEVWQTSEVAKDARAPQWSPDGRHLGLELGTAAPRKVRVVRAVPGFPPVLEVDGLAPSFSPDGRSIGWLARGSSPTLRVAALDGTGVRE